jgi:DNA polymerase-4
LRVAYVHIAEFEVEVERELGRAPREGAVVLGGSAHDRFPVRRASGEATREGVREGMPLREAAARCPTAVFLPYDQGAYAEASARVVGTLQEYSDAVEPDGYGCAYLDASGWGGLATRLRTVRELAVAASHSQIPSAVSIGLAPTKFTARLAARDREAVAVPDWMEEEFLSSFPVEMLPLGERNLRRLRRLGIRTIGEFVALPPSETKLQFGAEGRLARSLATGQDPRPVSPPPVPGALQTRRSFDPPLDDRETVRRVVEREAIVLCGQLEANVARSVEVCLGHVSTVAVLPAPSAAVRDIALACNRALDRLAPEVEAVSAVEMRLLRVGPEVVRQASLWDAARPSEPAHALARLREQFGPDRLRRVVPGDPASLLPRKQFSLVEAS